MTIFNSYVSLPEGKSQLGNSMFEEEINHFLLLKSPFSAVNLHIFSRFRRNGSVHNSIQASSRSKFSAWRCQDFSRKNKYSVYIYYILYIIYYILYIIYYILYIIYYILYIIYYILYIYVYIIYIYIKLYQYITMGFNGIQWDLVGFNGHGGFLTNWIWCESDKEKTLEMAIGKMMTKQWISRAILDKPMVQHGATLLVLNVGNGWVAGVCWNYYW